MAVSSSSSWGACTGPLLSRHLGAWRSPHNYYPVSHMRPEEGIVQMAIGFGKTVVGGTSSPFLSSYPEILPQFPPWTT